MTPLVSAIVLNTRAGRDASECVLDLVSQTDDQETEILVIDNHSEDDSIGILRNRLKDFPNIRILEARKNLGFGKGYDIGIRQARGAYILINNPVKRLVPGALKLMIEKMNRDPDIGIIAPKLAHSDGTVRFSPRSFPHLFDVVIKRTFLKHVFTKQMQRYLQLDDNLDRERDTDWVGGGCMLVRRSVLEKTGSFDPRFFLFFEDIDLCRRVWAAGYRVVYFPKGVAMDRKRRFSEMPAYKMPFNRVGRAHIASAIRYFWKWRKQALPR